MKMCKKGLHEMVPENIYVFGTKRRRTCRICWQVYQVQFRKQNRERLNANRREWGKDKQVHLTKQKKAWDNDHREHMAAYHRLKTHGVAEEQYREMLLAQNNACALCGTFFEKPVKGKTNKNSPCIDHDHTTEHLRDILCWSCNVGLGHFKDDPDLLVRAAAYIQAHHDFQREEQ